MDDQAAGGGGLGTQWVFDDELEKLKDQNYNGIRLDDRSNFETDMSNWAPIPSPASHGVDRQFDKLLKDRHDSKMKLIQMEDQKNSQSLKVPPLNIHHQRIVSTGDSTKKSNQLDETTDSKRVERAHQLLE